MPNYKLTYFAVRGRAEAIRFIFHYAGVAYEDVVVSKEDWPKLKLDTPMGQVPVLEVDGQKLCQSMTIARYLAKEFGIAGKDLLEQARADMVVDGVGDCITAARPYIMARFGGDAAKTEEAWTAFKGDALKKFFETFTKLLAENGSGWFVGSELTWADLVVAEFVQRISEREPAMLDAYPALKAHEEKVLQLPKIAAWIAKRPAYSF